jgi:uncharacterized phage infection (PIP) family protein YhgE
MKNKTIKNLILFGIFTIIFINANSAMAYVSGVWDPTPRIENNSTFTTVVSSPITNIVVADSTPKTTPITPKLVQPVKTVTATPKPVVKSDANNLPAVNNTTQTDNNGLTALSFKGSGGFMPSSVWQWILVIFLILIVIILARMISKPASHNNNHNVAPAH